MEDIAKLVLISGLVLPPTGVALYGIKSLIDNNHMNVLVPGVLVSIMSIAGICVC